MTMESRQGVESRGAATRALWGLIALLAVLLPGAPALGMEITPFRTGNMSPLVQIHGLPVPDSARILPRRQAEATLSADLANNFAIDETGRDAITLDGETYRFALDLRYGFAEGVEGGIEIPAVAHSGGFLDGFVEWFHSAFGFTNGGRDEFPTEKLVYRYRRDGSDRFRLEDGGAGIGDIRLTGGVRLYDQGTENPGAVALRAALKLPTGDSGRLRGSGSVDFSLWLAASDDYSLGSWGHLTIFGNAGGTVMGDGKVLKEQQRNLAGFGTVGFGWSPADWIAIKVQTLWHSPLYQGSGLRELANESLVITSGGTLAFSKRTTLDIGVSEDLSVKTAPDVVFHFALRQRF